MKGQIQRNEKTGIQVLLEPRES
jgi:hypothetical protein